jgi:PAS domain S-box-containing protein
MDRPVAGNSPTTEPERFPQHDSATAFFPDFATVQAALEAGQIGIWSCDLATNAVTWSSNVESICGFSQERFDGTFASLEQSIHEKDRARVLEAFDETRQTGRPFRLRYRVAPSNGRNDVWIEATGTVTYKDGVPVRLIGLCHDVTEQVKLQDEIRSRAKQQSALAQLGERALVETDIERLLNDVASTIALTLAVDFVEVLELLPGNIDLLLRAGFGWKAGCIGSIVTAREDGNYARHILDSAKPIVVADFPSESRFVVPRYLQDHRCVSGMSTMIAGRDGRAYGILGVCTNKPHKFSAQDTSFLAAIGNLVAGAIQRRQLEERHELMIRELRHRSGNLFSQLLALFSQTAKNSKTMAELTGKYQARVLALANAHRLITEAGWKSTPLEELLRVLLGPYLERTTLAGPNVDVAPDPTFTLSAALHELAANAAKHGSLSRPKGKLEVNWSVKPTQSGMTLTLDWIERNGPPARRPRRAGFGSRLIALVVERQMNGEVERTYSRQGLSVRLIVPLTHERWPTQLPPPGTPEPAAR